MNIKNISLDALMQLLGMLGVLGGLVFVGLEMHQSQQIALAGQMQSRAEQITDYNLAFLETADPDDLYVYRFIQLLPRCLATNMGLEQSLRELCHARGKQQQTNDCFDPWLRGLQGTLATQSQSA